MVTISNADKALKTFYLGVLADQLNVGINPFLAKISQTTSDVWGKEIKKLAPYGINGGIGSGGENDNLPSSGENNYAQFSLGLKNLFGKIEISDKAIRASQNSAGAFVNLLNAEMDGLLKASKFNFGRMIYGDGSGLIAKTIENGDVNNFQMEVDTIRNMIEGMTIDVFTSNIRITPLNGSRITKIDRKNNIVTVNAAFNMDIGDNCKVYVQGSKNNEITGLEALFSNSQKIYGLSREDYTFLTPYQKTLNETVTPCAIQDAIDEIEKTSGGSIDYIVTSYKLRKQYVNYMAQRRTNIDYMTLDGGYKALSYAGIPLVADKFVDDNTMYLLNSKDFKMHQLCDWRWLEGENGTVLHQIPGKASYSATLVKYADLLCEKPMGQAKLIFTGSEAEKRFFNISFDANGGSEVASQIVLPNANAVKPTNPTKSGSVFNDWFYNGSEFDFSMPISKDVKLVAEWN